jgi:hypothetical protein
MKTPQNHVKWTCSVLAVFKFGFCFHLVVNQLWKGSGNEPNIC